MTLKEKITLAFQEKYDYRDNICDFMDIDEAIQKCNIITKAQDKETQKYLDLLNAFDYALCELEGVYFMIDNQVNEFFNGRIAGCDDLASSAYYAAEQFGDCWFDDHNIDFEKFWSTNLDIKQCYINE